ncbi:hypothetical protein H257_08668 [Aphanomyces astaci]|uniref:Transposase Tc1-like domain-containing protein n=1 Tax=Aphanomyces astaci TaxID=112090 RepID=W4GFK3_APHAT|nr:hypothetical protein H257_08668 [Aphanomyces astaci]ETV77844.1 hypothetical protein H257_08668 [Aphanomyces astaci]|eukprot:XP_009832954.1 hypothetical protein H257_08668 [Aphanomyces astaci]
MALTKKQRNWTSEEDLALLVQVAADLPFAGHQGLANVSGHPGRLQSLWEAHRRLQGRDETRLIQLLRPFLKKDKLQRGAFKHVAEIMQIHPRTVSYIWLKFRDTGSTTSNKVGKVGPKPTYSKQLVQQLVEEVHVDQRSTLRDVAAGSGLTMGTLSRHLKNGTFERRSTRIKPLLSDVNKAERDRRKVYLVPGEKPPRRAWKSKRFVPKVMFLAAVARPRYDEVGGVQSQDRHVAVCSFCACHPQLAQPTGWYYGDVIPAIKASFPSANKRVVLQHDNATPHGAITDSELAAVSTDGFFASIQSLQYKKMSRSVDDVVRNTMEAFDELNHEKLDNVFLTFQAVMRLILEHSGCNGYALPHLKKESLRRAGLLMSNVSCPVSLLL